jgi:hypothetical protein
VQDAEIGEAHKNEPYRFGPQDPRKSRETDNRRDPARDVTIEPIRHYRRKCDSRGSAPVFEGEGFDALILHLDREGDAARNEFVDAADARDLRRIDKLLRR